MRREEARTILQWILALKLPAGTLCLNLGSSTGEFRSEVQPHIETELFAPLKAAGLVVLHCDVKSADGVDEVGDLLDPAFQSKLRAKGAKLILCSNLLEHLTDAGRFANACGALVEPGGYGIFTVPYSYPYHPDPIDTMFRPSPDKLAAMLENWVTVRQEVIKGGNHWKDLQQSGEPVRRLIRQIGRVALPFYRSKHWKHIAHRLLWLYRPFTSSAVLLRKAG